MVRLSLLAFFILFALSTHLALGALGPAQEREEGVEKIPIDNGKDKLVYDLSRINYLNFTI